MNRWLGLLLGFVTLGIPAAAQHDFKAMFEKQVENSCPSGSMLKAVTELGEGLAELGTETKSLELVCSGEEKREGAVLLADELQYALELYALDPMIRDHFKHTENGREYEASVLEEDADETDLKMQRFVMDEAGKVLRTVYAKIHRDAWFYKVEIEITVNFDAAGRYESHKMVTQTDIALFGGNFATAIAGKFTPAAAE